MRYQEFNKLTQTQQVTLLIAMHVRNEMEDFHVEHLSDTQMKQLNLIIRQAIFDMVSLTNKRPETEIEQKKAAQAIDWLVKMVPEYWEIPEKTSGDLELPEESLRQTDKKDKAV
jgi:hypothetical protein